MSGGRPQRNRKPTTKEEFDYGEEREKTPIRPKGSTGPSQTPTQAPPLHQAPTWFPDTNRSAATGRILKKVATGDSEAPSSSSGGAPKSSPPNKKVKIGENVQDPQASSSSAQNASNGRLMGAQSSGSGGLSSPAMNHGRDLRRRSDTGRPAPQSNEQRNTAANIHRLLHQLAPNGGQGPPARRTTAANRQALLPPSPAHRQQPQLYPVKSIGRLPSNPMASTGLSSAQKFHLARQAGGRYPHPTPPAGSRHQNSLANVKRILNSETASGGSSTVAPSQRAPMEPPKKTTSSGSGLSSVSQSAPRNQVAPVIKKTTPNTSGSGSGSSTVPSHPVQAPATIPVVLAPKTASSIISNTDSDSETPVTTRVPPVDSTTEAEDPLIETPMRWAQRPVKTEFVMPEYSPSSLSSISQIPGAQSDSFSSRDSSLIPQDPLLHVVKTEPSLPALPALKPPKLLDHLTRIDAQPRKLVFNAPYIYDQKNLLLIKNNSDHRSIAFRLLFSDTRITSDNLTGIIAPNETFHNYVTCKAFDFDEDSQETHKICISYTNVPRGEIEYSDTWFEEEDGMNGMKVIHVEYSC